MRTSIGIAFDIGVVTAVAITEHGSTELQINSPSRNHASLTCGDCKSCPIASSDPHVEHADLIKSALAQLRQEGVGGVDQAVIAIGTPVSYYVRHKQTMANLLTQPPCDPTINSPRIFPPVIQPLGMGLYHKLMLNEQGLVNPGRNINKETWAVVNTDRQATDIMLVQQGKWVARAAGGALFEQIYNHGMQWVECDLGQCQGTDLAVKQLQQSIQKSLGIRLDWLEAKEATTSNKIKTLDGFIDVTAQVLEAYAHVATKIADRTDLLLGEDISRLYGVMVTGSTAGALYPHLLERWPNALIQPGRLFAAAHGMARFALAKHRSEPFASVSSSTGGY